MGVIWSISAAMLRGYARFAPTDRGAYRMVRAARAFVPSGQRCGVHSLGDGRHLELDLDLYPDCCMAVGLYELPLQRWLRRLIKPGSHIVDGGAYVGYFTTLAAMLAGEAGRVDAFEPLPQTHHRLAANVARNGVAGRVRLHQAALWDRPDKLAMRDSADSRRSPASATLVTTAAASDATVSTVSLDDVLAGDVPDVIKLDLEGAELHAIRGMVRTLRADNPPAVLMECNPQALAAAGTSARELVGEVLASQSAYRVFVLGMRLHRVSQDHPIFGDPHGCNLLFATDSRLP